MSSKRSDTPVANFQEKYEIRVVQDDRVTVAEIVVQDTSDPFDKGGVIGRGVARRRKGDRRQPGYGITLAILRAFREAVKTAERSLLERGYEVPAE